MKTEVDVFSDWFICLTHWGQVTHICVGNLPSIGSYNGLSPDRRQACIWTNAGILLIGPCGKKFSEILFKIITFSFKKTRSKVPSGKRRPSCLGLNELTSNKVTPLLRRLGYSGRIRSIIWLLMSFFPASRDHQYSENCLCKILMHLAIRLKNVNLLCHRSIDGSWPQFRRRELLWCLNQWTYTSSSLTSKVILRAARERPVGQGETACCSTSMRAISVIWVMSPIWSATVLFAQRLNQADTKDITPATCNRILHYNYKNNYK